MIETVHEASEMAKSQKSILLNGDLSDLLAAHQKKTGANFTRAVTAAIIQYLFSEPEGPNPYWMETAVELDLDEISVADIPLQRRDHVSSECLSDLDTKTGPDGKIAQVPAESGIAYSKWSKLIAKEGEDGIEKILAAWTEANKR